MFNTKEHILEEVFKDKVNKDDAFLLFSICHMYGFDTEWGYMSAETQRSSGDCLTYIWPESDYVDWYWLWNTEWGEYQHFENLNVKEEKRLKELLCMLINHPKVNNVSLEKK